MQSSEAESRAKELFFEYDGSEFFMSRDGAEEEFSTYNVPSETRREWMRELTAQRLSALDQPGNWWSIYFLKHHSDYGHVPEVLAARPLGKWWEQVAYLEEMQSYVRQARWTLHASGRDVARAAEIALEYGEPLLASADEQRRRVEDLLRNARRRARWRM